MAIYRCHLVTQEVVSAIQDGMRDTQVGTLFCILEYQCLITELDRNLASLHVRMGFILL